MTSALNILGVLLAAVGGWTLATGHLVLGPLIVWAGAVCLVFASNIPRGD